MGIDTGDYDGDGRLDLVVTNLDFEMHTLDRGLDRGLFAYASAESGIGFPTLPFVGFGVYRLITRNMSLTTSKRAIAAGVAGYVGIVAAAMCAAFPAVSVPRDP